MRKIVMLLASIAVISACQAQMSNDASINKEPNLAVKPVPGLPADRKIAAYPMPIKLSEKGDRLISKDDAIAIAREVGGTTGELLEEPKLMTFEEVKKELKFFSYDFGLDERAYVMKLKGFGGRLAELSGEKGKGRYTKMTIVISERGGKPIGGLAE